nr:MAG TPA: hypothetical protein [Caudoviricetes sp.]DAT26051.1 MAG TPA: hypothetical protein [Caudoviricetes sp.]
MGNQRVRQTRSTLWASGRSFTGCGSLWINLQRSRPRLRSPRARVSDHR